MDEQDAGKWRRKLVIQLVIRANVLLDLISARGQDFAEGVGIRYVTWEG